MLLPIWVAGAIAVGVVILLIWTHCASWNGGARETRDTLAVVQHERDQAQEERDEMEDERDFLQRHIDQHLLLAPETVDQYRTHSATLEAIRDTILDVWPVTKAEYKSRKTK